MYTPPPDLRAKASAKGQRRVQNPKEEGPNILAAINQLAAQQRPLQVENKTIAESWFSQEQALRAKNAPVTNYSFRSVPSALACL